jgi:hypothetical protein
VSKKHLDVKLVLDFTKKNQFECFVLQRTKDRGTGIVIKKKIQPYFMNEKKLDMETKGRRDK